MIFNNLKRYVMYSIATLRSNQSGFISLIFFLLIFLIPHSVFSQSDKLKNKLKQKATIAAIKANLKAKGFDVDFTKVENVGAAYTELLAIHEKASAKYKKCMLYQSTVPNYKKKYDAALANFQSKYGVPAANLNKSNMDKKDWDLLKRTKDEYNFYRQGLCSNVEVTEAKRLSDQTKSSLTAFEKEYGELVEEWKNEIQKRADRYNDGDDGVSDTPYDLTNVVEFDVLNSLNISPTLWKDQNEERPTFYWYPQQYNISYDLATGTSSLVCTHMTEGDASVFCQAQMSASVQQEDIKVIENLLKNKLGNEDLKLKSYLTSSYNQNLDTEITMGSGDYEFDDIRKPQNAFDDFSIDFAVSRSRFEVLQQAILSGNTSGIKGEFNSGNAEMHVDISCINSKIFGLLRLKPTELKQLEKGDAFSISRSLPLSIKAQRLYYVERNGKNYSVKSQVINKVIKKDLKHQTLKNIKDIIGGFVRDSDFNSALSGKLDLDGIGQRKKIEFAWIEYSVIKDCEDCQRAVCNEKNVDPSYATQISIEGFFEEDGGLPVYPSKIKLLQKNGGDEHEISFEDDDQSEEGLRIKPGDKPKYKLIFIISGQERVESDWFTMKDFGESADAELVEIDYATLMHKNKLPNSLRSDLMPTSIYVLSFFNNEEIPLKFSKMEIKQMIKDREPLTLTIADNTGEETPLAGMSKREKEKTEYQLIFRYRNKKYESKKFDLKKVNGDKESMEIWLDYEELKEVKVLPKEILPEE